MSDVEKNVQTTSLDYESDHSGQVSSKRGIDKFNDYFGRQFHAETRGIEWIPEDERHDTSLWNSASMWLGGNMVIATFSLGTLGSTIWYMTFWDSFLCIIFFNILGALPVAYYSTFGPVLGLRQMPLSRFWFGYQGVRIIALLNCIACIGWSSVNTMVSAQMLHTVNNGGMPIWAGVFLISAITFIIAVFGYKFVHIYEKWSWIPNVIIFIIIAVRFGMSGKFSYGSLATGPVEAAGVLSFGGAIFGFATGWCSYASDYTAYKPANSSRSKIFFSVLAGLSFPLMFCMILGAACAQGLYADPTWQDYYDSDNVGGLVYAIMVPKSLHGFGQFCQVVLALSTVSNNIPNMYSLGLSAQTVWSGFRLIPRAFWTLLGCGAATAIAIPAYYSFNTFMDNFMNIIGYWLAIYSAIALNEHFFFKKGFAGYDSQNYDKPSMLPVGIAAMFGFCCGVAGAVLGMAQVWYVGPIGKLIGDPAYGGDIGFELAFGFATVGFHSLRWFEYRHFQR